MVSLQPIASTPTLLGAHGCWLRSSHQGEESIVLFPDHLWPPLRLPHSRHGIYIDQGLTAATCHSVMDLAAQDHL